MDEKSPPNVVIDSFTNLPKSLPTPCLDRANLGIIIIIIGKINKWSDRRMKVYITSPPLRKL